MQIKYVLCQIIHKEIIALELFTANLALDDDSVSLLF